MTTVPAGRREHAETLRTRLAEAEDMLRAIRQGEIDALVVEGADGAQIYTLHSAEEPYRALVEQMQEGAVVLTSGGDILYANARFAALVGAPLQSVSGSRFGRFVHPSDRDAVERLLESGTGRDRCRLSGPGAVSFEVSLSLTTTKSARADRLNLIVTELSALLAIGKREAPAAPADVVVPRERRLKPRRVMLIENSGEAREFLHMVLELAGHLVYDAPDAARALELLDVVRPHAAIVDLGSEGVDGYQVGRRLRESPLGKDMLLLALNGHGSSGGGTQLLKNGFDYHLLNPLDPDYLARLIGHEVPGP
jgi:CheY-like chemotaxis protein